MQHQVVYLDNAPENLEIEHEILGAVEANLIDAEVSDRPLEELLVDADAVISSQTIIDDDLMDAMPNCRVISRTGIGVDYVNLDAATERGILVTNVPDYCIPEVSDHALALMLALQRQVIPYHEGVTEGRWERAVYTTHRIEGQTLGLVAFGNIAREFGRKARGLGMEVATHDPYLDDEFIREYDADPIGFEELLDRSDVLSLHTPLTDETKGMIGAMELERMKESALLINTARGGLIDGSALVEALDRGEIRGAGLDVLVDEPPQSDDPILDQENVVLTPHVGYYSEESRMELRKRVAENVCTVLRGDIPEHVVNRDVL